jgi:hypothetical protein
MTFGSNDQHQRFDCNRWWCYKPTQLHTKRPWRTVRAHDAVPDTAVSRSCSFCNLDERVSRSASANDTLVSSCRSNSAASANSASRSSALNRVGCVNTTARSGPRPIQQSVARLLKTYVTPAKQHRHKKCKKKRVNATHPGVAAKHGQHYLLYHRQVAPQGASCVCCLCIQHMLRRTAQHNLITLRMASYLTIQVPDSPAPTSEHCLHIEPEQAPAAPHGSTSRLVPHTHSLNAANVPSCTAEVEGVTAAPLEGAFGPAREDMRFDEGGESIYGRGRGMGVCSHV